jgi:hypothetical protein
MRAKGKSQKAIRRPGRLALHALIFCLLALAGCAGARSSGRVATLPPTSAPAIAVGQPFALRLGETALITEAGLSVTPQQIGEDSRCPVDAYCIWQGRVIVVGVLSLGGQAQPFTLGTLGGFADAPAQVAAGAFTLSLVDVEPYPTSQAPIPQEDYLLTLRLDRAP